MSEPLPNTPETQAPPVQSSPVTRVPLPFAKHKCDQVQTFEYDANIHQLADFQTPDALIRFLHVAADLLPPNTPHQEPNDAARFTLENFLNAANIMAKSIKEQRFSNSPLLVFKSTDNKSHHGHVTDTACRPDFTVAFEHHFDSNNTTLWPCIRLAGEKASGGKTKDDHKKQAISYLHYLLLARPDLYVAQGMLTSKDNITFLVGIGGDGIRSLAVDWSSNELYRLMYAFIYRLYDPNDFADKTYEMDPIDGKDFATFTIRIVVKSERDGVTTQEEAHCSKFLPIYASRPFQTRTHVLSNPDSEVMVNGEKLTVLKDQFCRRGTRFEEHTILDLIHTAEKVPGVVEAVYHEMIALPRLGRVGDPVRAKNRLGMRQSGLPFTSIPTVRAMLETVFDILEVLRFLRMRRQVLHRDISSGNIMYIDPPQGVTAQVVGTDAQEGGVLPVFAKRLLGESTNSRETSALLIDFNHAEHLESKQEPEYHRVSRTGTPLFIARAAQIGKALPLYTDSPGFILEAIPGSPESYTSKHPKRLKKFEPERATMIDPSEDNSMGDWRHELDHDVESVFWLMFYWALSAKPKEKPDEPIRLSTWALLNGSFEDRTAQVDALYFRNVGIGTVHSAFKPLLDLFRRLAGILRVDRHWLPALDTRNAPEYIVEAFQRIILQFIIDNRDNDFMKMKVGEEVRKLEKAPQHLNRSTTRSQSLNADNNKKRNSSQMSVEQSGAEQSGAKRPRHDPPEETALEEKLEDDGDENWY
ncbi:hypothetical protein M407DRAFT_22897 [Tulasnella calospora MUT 4182]|uniref:Fungal-type protein kinase domain-containing protein n=1 Tax=Tulasnella calospora MUT 4182 TaxID=1051891 RepID=A0A0C3M2E5_9AGAM|nr:hypothetical protein M407DRAFT_22897 [Tulasnella calospora MUT 4182]